MNAPGDCELLKFTFEHRITYMKTSRGRISAFNDFHKLEAIGPDHRQALAELREKILEAEQRGPKGAS